MTLDQAINYIENKVFLSILIVTLFSFELHGSSTLCTQRIRIKTHNLGVYGIIIMLFLIFVMLLLEILLIDF